MNKPATLISIAGPIAAGKTTLTQSLAEVYDARVLWENFAANPYLARFYVDQPTHALETQLHFLRDRFEQLRLDCWSKHGIILTDYLFAKDRLFAELTLDQKQLAEYNRVAEQIEGRIKQADLVVYLSANPAALLSRIKQRGREMEQAIVQDYLERVAAAYERLMQGYSRCPVIRVDTETRDVREKAVAAQIVEQINSHLPSHASR